MSFAYLWHRDVKRPKPHLQVVIGMALSCCVGGGALAQEAWIVPLSPLPGDVATQPSSGVGVAQFGSVLVGTSISSVGRQTAVRMSGGVTTSIGVLPGSTSSIAAACNLNGSTIVGACLGGGPARAFRYSAGVMTDLGVPPVSPASFPRCTGVSWSGGVVGGVVATGSGSTTPRGWVHEAGAFTMVGLRPGATGNTVRAVSGDGVYAAGDTDIGGTTVAYRWSRSTGSVVLVSPAASGPCGALGLSGDGSVVLGNCGSSGSLRAVVWVESTPLQLPPLFATDTTWEAASISGDGSLIGGQSGGKACAWSLLEQRARSIEDLLSVRGVNLMSWKLLSVTSISPDGQYIAGAGEYMQSNGVRRNTAWLARVPSFCPTDWNGDGGIDGGDVESFFRSWEAGSADLNLDGGTDGFDVDEFFARWVDGAC